MRQFTINDKSFTGNTISIINNTVLIDGKQVADFDNEEITIAVDGLIIYAGRGSMHGGTV